jgi:Cu-processing system permease protein
VKISFPGDVVNGIATIAALTWIEARRRRVVLAGVLCGLAFLAIYAVAVYFVHKAGLAEIRSFVQRQAILSFISLGGLFATNFLIVALAVMLPVDTLSGEIQSGVMQTLASKPIRRSDIVLGKWLVYGLMNAAYVAITLGGVALVVRVITGYVQPNLGIAFALVLLEATVLLTVTIAGGTRFTTITNGIAAFAFYGMAFIGGWIEQIGSFVGNQMTRYIGTVISLVSPTDVLWRLAAYHLQPPITRELQNTPFSLASVPSQAMVLWACGFVVVVLVAALRAFERRTL